MDLKQFLKQLKLNESTISIILGGIVIVLVAVLFISQTRQLSVSNISDISSVIPEVSNDIEPPQTENAENESTYTVAAGDSFWSIAEEKYGSGYEWVKIAQANPDVDPLAISAGDKLSMPEAGQITGEAVATANEEEQTTDSHDMAQDQQESSIPDTYTVEHGDSLWEISVAVYGNGFRWSEIAQLNNLAHPNVIHAGNVLKLPHL